jgi:hypothetical protein
MADLRKYPETELVVQVGAFELRVKPTEQTIALSKIRVRGIFVPQAKEEDESLYSSLLSH